MLKKLSSDNLMSLEQYAKVRDTFRKRVIAHKKVRRVALGDHANLYFEDYLTMQYQAQEILRAERIFEQSAIDEEVAVYNDLIPDGGNWKATFMLEYTDVQARRQELQKLIGVEDCIYTRVGSSDKLYAIADEDLPRSTDDKTSSVHFVRFPLTESHIADARAGVGIWLGVDHEHLQVETQLSPETQVSLVADLGDGDGE